MSSEASDFFLIIGVETVGWGLISWRSVYSIMDFCWLWLDVKLVNLHFSITERREVSVDIDSTASTWKIEIIKNQKHYKQSHYDFEVWIWNLQQYSTVLSIFLYYYPITDVRQFNEIGFIKGLETYQNSKFRRRKCSIFV